MIQANGGNDTIDVTGSIIDSTVYGGQGTDYISGVDGATSISASVIEGNLGADKIILASTTSVFNTELYGSSSAGTDTGADSIVVSARTVQTSSVYGGAGADTLLLGNLASGQFVDVDIRPSLAMTPSTSLVRSLAPLFPVVLVTTPSSLAVTLFRVKVLLTLLSLQVTELTVFRHRAAASLSMAVRVPTPHLMVLTHSTSPTCMTPPFTVLQVLTASCWRTSSTPSGSKVALALPNSVEVVTATWPPPSWWCCC